MPAQQLGDANAADTPLVYTIRCFDSNSALLGTRKPSRAATIEYLQQHLKIINAMDRDWKFQIIWNGPRAEKEVDVMEDVWETVVYKNKNLPDIKVHISEPKKRSATATGLTSDAQSASASTSVPGTSVTANETAPIASTSTSTTTTPNSSTTKRRRKAAAVYDSEEEDYVLAPFNSAKKVKQEATS